MRRGQLGLGSQLTVREAGDAFIAGARAGTIRNRSGEPYKPSVVRGYETALRLRVMPVLGGAKLSALSRIDLQRYVDRLLAEGLDPSSVRNALMPLRVIYRRAHARGEVAVNPTRGLELPAPRGRRDRVAAPAEADALVAALEPGDRALWATALYAGLRTQSIRVPPDRGDRCPPGRHARENARRNSATRSLVAVQSPAPPTESSAHRVRYALGDRSGILDC